ncbi:hypothetical protein HR11_05380 [Porphyromonas macacae]|uniref:copper resistance protein NlpE n=1 Tax=Porphyromonas macacae TaxID=28115 RepID=UPI00052C3351|nr:copper resistance protein NlpE [Porphyromonas macacae]KGN99661.1 hypothetical protein HR11_05380 [Porphyromonas macacae]
MKLLKLFLAGAIVVCFTNCTNSKKQNTADTQQETEIKTETAVETAKPDYFGIYEGTLPCADCEGIKTTLTINEDTTYTLISEYLGKKDNNVFETSGVYNIINENVIELVTPSSGEKTYYKILDNSSVALCDDKGTLNEGELAAHYILKRK